VCVGDAESACDRADDEPLIAEPSHRSHGFICGTPTPATYGKTAVLPCRFDLVEIDSQPFEFAFREAVHRGRLEHALRAEDLCVRVNWDSVGLC